MKCLMNKKGKILFFNSELKWNAKFVVDVGKGGFSVPFSKSGRTLKYSDIMIKSTQVFGFIVSSNVVNLNDKERN